MSGIGRIAALVAVAGLVLAGAMDVASASQLRLEAAELSQVDVGHPCSGTATATAATAQSATGVLIEVPGGCAGRTVTLVVLSGSAPIASGSREVAVGGSTTVPVGAYTPSAALTIQAVVDGWNLPVSWSYVPPVRFGTCEVRSTATDAAVPGRTCTVQDMRVDTPWGAAGSRLTNLYVQVTSNKQSHTEYLWFDLDVSDARGLPTNWSWTRAGIAGDQIRPPAGYSCASLPGLVGRGIASWGGGSSVYYANLYENRSGVSNLSCAG